MINRLFIIALSALCIPGISTGQEENDAWDTYIAQFEKGPGSVLINMSLKQRAPVAKYTYVLITGVTFGNCTVDGFPEQDEFARLHNISDSVEALVQAITPNILAGAFTHQCERLDYYYITDTQQLRTRLEALYKKRFSNYKPYINIREDKNWEGYLSFLYPNEQTLHYMGDSKVVLSLSQAGDKLEKPRPVDHFIYFTEEKKPERFYRICDKGKIQGRRKSIQ